MSCFLWNASCCQGLMMLCRTNCVILPWPYLFFFVLIIICVECNAWFFYLHLSFASYSCWEIFQLDSMPQISEKSLTTSSSSQTSWAAPTLCIFLYKLDPLFHQFLRNSFSTLNSTALLKWLICFLSSLAVMDCITTCLPPNWNIIWSPILLSSCMYTTTLYILAQEPLQSTGYQNLILHAYQEFKGVAWLEYDHCFRQQAAAVPSNN